MNALPRHPRTILIVALGATTAYAILRYNVFKGVSWAHLPLYVLNKAVAWSSILLFALAAWHAVRTRSAPATSARFVEGAALAAVHTLMSLALLSPASYPAFYDRSQQLRLFAQLALLGGVVGVAAMAGAGRIPRLVLALPGAALVHTTWLGARAWVSPADWPGYMVPISLLSALAALAALILTVAWAARTPRE